MIYVIQQAEASRFCKIGYAKDLAKRLRGMSTASASDLVVLASCQGTLAQEHRLHFCMRTLAPRARARGEWYLAENAHVQRVVLAIEAGTLSSWLIEHADFVAVKDYCGSAFSVQRERVRARVDAGVTDAGEIARIVRAASLQSKIESIRDYERLVLADLLGCSKARARFLAGTTWDSFARIMGSDAHG